MEEERDINDGCERESKMNGEGEKKDDRRGRQWMSEAEKDGKTARERDREKEIKDVRWGKEQSRREK